MASRADRRRASRSTVAVRAAAASPRPGVAGGPRGASNGLSRETVFGRALPLALLAVLLATHWWWFQGKVTWYLAVDQHGYYAFARDLLHGRLFHPWSPAGMLGDKLWPRTDVLAQTYIFDQGWIYSRYAPGFPILLAAWLGVFGESNVHALNPILFCVAMGLVATLVRKTTGSWWRGLAAASLVAICPTQIHWWGATLTRDVATHAVAWTGLCLLLPRFGGPLGGWRSVLGAFAVGFASSMRPDAALYLLPAALLVWRRLRHGGFREARGALLRLGLGWFAGVLPILAYDLAATGSPLPPQAIEIKPLLEQTSRALSDWLVPQAHAARGWHGGVWEPVQGGAWNPANFRRVFPLQIRAIQLAYGPVLLGFVVLGALVSFLVHRDLFLAAVPYAVASLLFFSCWVRPDARYLVGFHLFCATLLVEGVLGTIDLLRRLLGRGTGTLARFLGVAFVVLPVGGALFASRLVPALLGATWICAGTAAVAAAATLAWPDRRIVRFAAPALGLLAFVLAMRTDLGTIARNAGIQGPEVARARAVVQSRLPANAVVLTTEDVGRPQENLEIYADRRAIYLTDLQRWQEMRPVEAAFRLLRNGQRVFLLLPAGQPETARVLADLPAENVLEVEQVETIPPKKAVEWFVAAPFHKGIELGLWEVREKDPGVHKPLSIGPIPDAPPPVPTPRS